MHENDFAIIQSLCLLEGQNAMWLPLCKLGFTIKYFTSLLDNIISKEITISVDLNHHSLIWKYGKQPVEVMPGLIQYYAVLDKSEQQSVSPIFQTNSVVDKAGSGGCFMAGMIYGILNRHDQKEIIIFAATTALGKLQEKGDATKNSVEQIKKILALQDLN